MLTESADRLMLAGVHWSSAEKRCRRYYGLTAMSARAWLQPAPIDSSGCPRADGRPHRTPSHNIRGRRRVGMPPTTGCVAPLTLANAVEVLPPASATDRRVEPRGGNLTLEHLIDSHECLIWRLRRRCRRLGPETPFFRPVDRAIPTAPDDLNTFAVGDRSKPRRRHRQSAGRFGHDDPLAGGVQVWLLSHVSASSASSCG
jgi:hypothetical protein